jgi:hypothetical protein
LAPTKASTGSVVDKEQAATDELNQKVDTFYQNFPRRHPLGYEGTMGSMVCRVARQMNVDPAALKRKLLADNKFTTKRQGGKVTLIFRA